MTTKKMRVRTTSCPKSTLIGMANVVSFWNSLNIACWDMSSPSVTSFAKSSSTILSGERASVDSEFLRSACVAYDRAAAEYLRARIPVSARAQKTHGPRTLS
jgi:hypothetical protein